MQLAHPQQGPRSSDQDLAEARCTLRVKLTTHSVAKAKADASCTIATSAAEGADTVQTQAPPLPWS